ncbi:MAG: hypothetical protein ACR2NU_11455 [Aeoliella sp.]
MWCQHCQQDVPAVSPAAGKPLSCAQCQKPIDRVARTEQCESVLTNPSEQLLDRQADQRMRQIGRSLRSPSAAGADLTSDVRQNWVDLPHCQSSNRDSSASRTVASEVRRSGAGENRMQAFAWLATMFGLGLAIGGVALLSVALFGEHPELWQWGVGVTLAGQTTLIAGLIRVLTSLWSNSRTASQRLVAVQQELAQVQRSAESLIAQRPGGASGFYGELTRGASPTVLLANLKGQIDHLATRLHGEV